MTGEPEAFYVPIGDAFEATELTRGPWDPEGQHAGPPAALLGRAIELHDGVGSGPEERFVARVTFEILRPVPIGRLRVETGTIRPGRRVELIEATLLDEEGEPLIRARAWRILRGEVSLPADLADADGDGIARPDTLVASNEFFPTGQDVGYHTAMEYRFAAGSFLEPGPATTWLRMLHPLVAGEEPTPLTRVLIAADTGNGISNTLDFRRYLFINVDLTVHLHRLPAGEWVCLESVTIPEAHGVGLTDTTLLDERGRIGRAAQSLVVGERES